MSEAISRKGEDGIFVFDNVSSLDDLASFLNHDWVRDSEGYIWRGQRKASWQLRPTLDRVLAISDSEVYARAAAVVLDRFRLATRGRIRTTEVPDSAEDWWALAQHYGLPTPLLDWTTSPYVATFFAFAGSEPDDEASRALFMLHHPSVSRKAAELGESAIRFFTPHVGNNLRLINQSGLFSQFPCAIDIEQWVRTNFARSQQIVLGKLILPGSVRRSVLKTLNSMNINYNTLFPDLEGAAKHVSLSLHVPNYLRRRRVGEESDF